MTRTEARSSVVCFEVEKLALRRDTIVTLLAILVIAIALPFAIVDTFEQGRVYIFSRQFLEELPQRFTGPGRLRFILQPVTAMLLGIRGGLHDAKTGNPPYLFGLLFGAEHRRELLQSGVAAIRNLVALGIIMDIVLEALRAIYEGIARPGATDHGKWRRFGEDFGHVLDTAGEDIEKIN